MSKKGHQNKVKPNNRYLQLEISMYVNCREYAIFLCRWNNRMTYYDNKSKMSDYLSDNKSKMSDYLSITVWKKSILHEILYPTIQLQTKWWYIYIFWLAQNIYFENAMSLSTVISPSLLLHCMCFINNCMAHTELNMEFSEVMWPHCRMTIIWKLISDITKK